MLSTLVFMDISSLVTFMGRLHPVLVHLPIGILLLASFFQLLTTKGRFAFLHPAIPVMFFFGMLTAVFSCITGYLLSLNGEYEEQLVDWHQWMGILTAVVSILLCITYRLAVVKVSVFRIVSVVIIILVMITGHLGGSLTHGENYLTEMINKKGNEGGKTSNIQDAALYDDIVQPILKAKCYGCHGENKQKGKLRLDKQEFILKGGEDGKVLISGKADESDMMEKIWLPVTDEDHMPPKSKPQLTATEISLLKCWINSGADFHKKISELPQAEDIKPLLAAWQTGVVEVMSKADVPAAPVDAPNEKVVKQLKAAGVVVQPVATGSHYLLVNFVTVNSIADDLVKLLPALKEQIVWLKLDDKTISDSSLDEIAKLQVLTRLSEYSANI